MGILVGSKDCSIISWDLPCGVIDDVAGESPLKICDSTNPKYSHG